ncbi:unnamed protein product [Discosporangium mesarthrocarpum]
MKVLDLCICVIVGSSLCAGPAYAWVSVSPVGRGPNQSALTQGRGIARTTSPTLCRSTPVNQYDTMTMNVRGKFRSILRAPGRALMGRSFSVLFTSNSDDMDDEYDDDEEGEDEYDYDEELDRGMVKQLRGSSTLFKQVSWLSWWAQTILSTVAAIILLFSNAVTDRRTRGNVLGNGVALAMLSLFLSGASIFWTWGYTLKADRWRRLGSLSEVEAAQHNIRGALRVGVWVNIVGMLLALVGAEQIVGTLVAKVLYSQGFQPSVMVGTAGAAEFSQAQFRALDVFVVQANTNTLLSHFCALSASLWLTTQSSKLNRDKRAGSR